MSPAVFLDRDGVLIQDKHLITELSQVHVLPRVRESLELLRSIGHRLIVITNQAAVARGMLSLQEAQNLNAEILKLANVTDLISDTYLCPHHPRATQPEYRLDCNCRKPKSGMLLEAAKTYQLDLSRSYIVGDRPTDIYAGKNVGCSGIQIETGEHNSPLIETTIDLDEKLLKPDYKCRDLWEACLWIQRTS